MNHPFFSPGDFPFARSEAIAFLNKISATYQDLEEIKELFELSGGDLSRLKTYEMQPYYVWREALRILGRMGKVEELCRLLLDKPEAPTTRPVIESLANADQRPLVPEGQGPSLLERSRESTRAAFLRDVMKRAREVPGLAIFISPYAAYDVDRIGDPRLLARAVVKKSLDDLRADYNASGPEVPLDSDVLSNMLVATAAGLAMSTGYDGLWNRICDIGPTDGGHSRLYPELADLARRWQKASKNVTGAQPQWQGLLFLTFDMNGYLERELANAGVSFGVLNVLAAGKFSYLKSEGLDVDKQLKLTQVWSFPEEPKPSGRGRSAIPMDSKQGSTRGWSPEHSVVVVKLMGFAQLRALRPLLGFEVLDKFREQERMPLVVTRQLGRSPFVMLGGGLLDPFVALALEAHFKEAAKGEPRWVVFHPWPPEDDMLRTTERVINGIDEQWTRKTYKLDPLVEDLPTIVSMMNDRISPAVDAGATA